MENPSFIILDGIRLNMQNIFIPKNCIEINWTQWYCKEFHWIQYIIYWNLYRILFNDIE